MAKIKIRDKDLYELRKLRTKNSVLINSRNSIEFTGTVSDKQLPYVVSALATFISLENQDERDEQRIPESCGIEARR